MTLRIGSLCTGYGGLDMAVESVLGGELAWVADNDPGASAILAHRFPAVPNLGDIAATRWDEVEPVDILAAGFPCQDVSCAGARKGLRKGNRTGAWSYVAEAIGALRPPLVFLENVRGLLTFGADSNLEPCPWCMGDSGDESVLRACGAVLADLAGLGFDAEWLLVSAAEVGAPHRRERVFIVATPAMAAAPSREDAGALLDGGTLRGRGLHLRARGQAPREFAPSPCPFGTSDDGRGCGSPVCPYCGSRESEWPVPPEGTGDEAMVALDDECLRRGGPHSERDVAWTVLSPPCKGEGSHDHGSAGSPRKAQDRGGSLGAGDSTGVLAWPAADAHGATERSCSMEAGGGLVVAVPGYPQPRRCRDGQHAPAQDPDRATSGERRLPAPGQAESRGARADAGRRDRAPAADARGARLGQHPGEPPAEEAGPLAGDEPPDRRGLRPAAEWGPYALAIRRWEHVTGRPAPRPTEPGRTGERLSPRFVEWMMGLPEGWVTDVPGLSRNAQLKALGNGVVPQQAAMALRLLLDRADIPSLVAASTAGTQTEGAA